MGEIKKVKIELELNHEEYNNLVEYIGKAPKIMGRGSQDSTEKIYNLEGRCTGNPPKFNGDLIVSEVLEKHPEDAKKVAESLKGLYEIIYKIKNKK